MFLIAFIDQLKFAQSAVLEVSVNLNPCFRFSHWTRSGVPAILPDFTSPGESISSNNTSYSGSPNINLKEKERFMTLNEIFLGQNSYNEDETIEYLADASLRPELLRPPPPLFLNPDGDDLFWLNPVDIQECLGDLEFIYEPRMCVESKASSLTEARRLMHRACKGNFTKSGTIIQCFV